MMCMMKSLLLPGFKLALVLLSCSSSVYAFNQKPIKIIVNDWTSQIVLSKVTGLFLQKNGYKVEYVQTPVAQQWGALGRGLADVQMEIWEGTMADMYYKLLNSGQIIDAGNHAALTREDWWYPDYVEEQCPGLPDWKALKSCAAIFSRGKNSKQGVYVAGPWEKPDRERIRALELNFRIQQLNHGDDLGLELEKAIKARQPIVLFNWTPNWVESRYAGKFVEFPEYDAACEQDPLWGVNPKYLHDCGNPKFGWLKKAVALDLPTTWPCAFDVIKRMSFSNEQIAELASYVDVDGLSYDSAANKWLDENSSVSASWLSEKCD
jgi:glycine betaine/proline transport system substrate-binding protein